MGSKYNPDIEEIKRLEAQVDGAWEVGDAEGFLDLFTNDVVWLPPGAPDVVGKEACREMVQDLLESTNFEQITSTNEEIMAIGEWAFHRFHVSMVATSKADGEARQMNFRAFRLLRKQNDGSWKIARYIWN